ncbi:MAG TPA: hypothetical protein PKA63_07300 [Oligoflexia bacterium]|nr:hypothetical protein [Oligoflexia bacterium]HMP48455.1 hypothetical protein [Oligoflexia bacterium]
MRLWSNSSVPKSNGGFNPEKRLLAAVLQRAITDFLSGDGEVQLSAREWLFSDEDTSETFCFSYICEALDFHGNELRKAISRQYDRQLKEAAAASLKTASISESATTLTVTAMPFPSLKNAPGSLSEINLPIASSHEISARMTGIPSASIASAAA